MRKLSTCLLLMSSMLILNPVIASNLQTQKVQPSGASLSDAGTKKKQLFDNIRKGIAIIKTKTYASSDAGSKEAWSGTGFVVDKKQGIIVTNRHVAGEMSVSTYSIKFSDGTSTTASLKYADPIYDFAFLKVDPEKLPKEVIELPLSLSPVAVNDTIYSMGNSARDEFSTYKGTVFSVYENIGPFAEQSFKFSGLTVPGASGSPIFNENGEIVGIIYGGKFVSGIALPISYVIDALEYLQKGTTPPRKSLGIVPAYQSLEDLVNCGLVSKEMQTDYLNKFPQSHNKILMINTRMVGSEAQNLFEPGDVIWSVNEEVIGPNLYRIDQIINSMEEKEVSIKVIRKNKWVTVRLKPYELSLQSSHRIVEFADTTWFGENELNRLMLGEKGPGVYIKAAAATSPFKKIFGESMWGDDRIVKILSIDGIELKSLDDLVKNIPSLRKKKEIEVTYIDFLGTNSFGGSVSADRQERLAIIKYESQFDTPKEYTFSTDTLLWDAKEINAGEKKEPIVEKKEAVIEKKAAVIEKKEPVIEKKIEAVVENKEAMAEKKASAVDINEDTD